jgi:hypothetical protein
VNSQSEWQCCASHLGYSLYDSLVTFFSTAICPWCGKRLPQKVFARHFSTVMFLYGRDTSTWGIYRYLPSNFLLIAHLMRFRFQRSRGIIGGEQTYCILPSYDSVWYCASCRKPYVHRKTTGRTRAAGRLVLHHKCGLNSVIHTRLVFRHCSNGIFVSNRRTN